MLSFSAVVWEIFGCRALPDHRFSALFLMLASDQLSPVPARPGADGLVQLGVTPADTVACQTGGCRLGCARHDHTVLPYGIKVPRDDIGEADSEGCTV